MAVSASPRIAARRAGVREEILDAAWELAREEGLVGMSLRKLAGKVGMQAPSLYAYFDSKDAIYDGMFVRGNEEFVEAMGLDDLAAAADLSPREHLIVTTRRYLDFCNQDTVRFQLLFQHAIPGWHPSPDAYASAVGMYRQMVDTFARAGITDPGAVDVWTAVTSGLASQQVANDPGGDRWVRLIEDVVEMFLAHHLPPARKENP